MSIYEPSLEPDDAHGDAPECDGCGFVAKTFAQAEDFEGDLCADCAALPYVNYCPDCDSCPSEEQDRILVDEWERKHDNFWPEARSGSERYCSIHRLLYEVSA